MTDEEFIAEAKAQYQSDGSVEIDDGAVVSRGSDNGAYVQAWVWVDDDHPSEQDEIVCTRCGGEITDAEYLTEDDGPRHFCCPVEEN